MILDSFVAFGQAVYSSVSFGLSYCALPCSFELLSSVLLLLFWSIAKNKKDEEDIPLGVIVQVVSGDDERVPDAVGGEKRKIILKTSMSSWVQPITF